MEALAHAEQGVRVESTVAVALHDDPTLTHAVGARQTPRLCIPQDQVLVVEVVFVDVPGPVRPLAHGAEGHLAAPPDLIEQQGNAVRRSEIDLEASVIEQPQTLQPRHLGDQPVL